MARMSFTGWGGFAAMLGGAIWVVALSIYATQPLGPQGWREGSFPLNPFMVAAFLLFFAGALGIYNQQRRESGWFGRIAVGVTTLGLALLAAGRVLVDLGLAPWYFAAGPAMMFILGLFLLGISVALTSVMPRAVGVFLAVGAFLMPMANFETPAIALAIPLGLAWMIAGYALWSRRGRSPTHLRLQE